jgi:flagellin-like hook-associated protein FlgL
MPDKKIQKRRKTMSSNTIQLSAGMRNTLLSLQQTNNLLNQTSERLATGKKVNSALDNALSYFTATSHTSRANDLSALKDSMGEAIQTIKAADAGIEGIIDLIDTMKGLAKDAYSADATEAASLETQYDAMATQITNMADDASYGGMNLLDSDTLTVTFNEDGTNTMTVSGFNAKAAGLGIIAADFASSGSIGSAIALLDAALATLRTKSQTMSANLSVITARQDFTTNMINALTIGADNLTAADTNEEGANMLMLQTRQSLGTTSLSLASQAAQSVLQLF